MGNDNFCNVDYGKLNSVKDLEKDWKKDFYKFPLGKNIACTCSLDIGIQLGAFACTYNCRCWDSKLPVVVSQIQVSNQWVACTCIDIALQVFGEERIACTCIDVALQVYAH